MLTWKEGDRFVVGETTYQAAPPDALAEGAGVREGEFFVFKSRALVERYVALIEELRPQQIFELGIYKGGSTLFLAELARPKRVVAIDLEPLRPVRERLEEYAARIGLAGVVRTFGEVDQADRVRLAEIAEGAFDGEPLDLVVDDCSHMYQPTRASFNELFPRLRPGGAYVIEDWIWAHSALESLFPDQTPLTRLLFEIALATPAVPGLIQEISVDIEAIVVIRGDAVVDPATFDVSACANPRGQALLAPA